MRRKRLFSILLTMMMLITTVLPANAMSTQEKAKVLSETVTPRAGTEDLPIGYTSMGSFIFYDTNLTPVKTVLGRHMTLMFGYSVASDDQGLGGIRLTVEIRDAYSGAVISSYQGTVERGKTKYVSHPVDLGYAGRKIRIFFDASSSGQSNGNFRRAYIQTFSAQVTN